MNKTQFLISLIFLSSISHDSKERLIGFQTAPLSGCIVYVSNNSPLISVFRWIFFKMFGSFPICLFYKYTLKSLTGGNASRREDELISQDYTRRKASMWARSRDVIQHARSTYYCNIMSIIYVFFCLNFAKFCLTIWKTRIFNITLSILTSVVRDIRVLDPLY